jgi:hypothetical protein
MVGGADLVKLTNPLSDGHQDCDGCAISACPNLHTQHSKLLKCT